VFKTILTGQASSGSQKDKKLNHTLIKTHHTSPSRIFVSPFVTSSSILVEVSAVVVLKSDSSSICVSISVYRTGAVQ
jgi:hypothetical protein